MAKIARRLLSIARVAELLKVDPGTIDEAVRVGTILVSGHIEWRGGMTHCMVALDEAIRFGMVVASRWSSTGTPAGLARAERVRKAVESLKEENSV